MPTNEKLKQLVMDYLTEAKLMQLATSTGPKPWIATVWYVNDKNMNLYFTSRRLRRHSMELEKNHNIAGAIVQPHTGGSGDKVRGLQFEGTARECNEEEFKAANELYRKKYTSAARVPPKSEGTGNAIAAFYIVKPSLLVLFDEINFPEQPRQELNI